MHDFWTHPIAIVARQAFEKKVAVSWKFRHIFGDNGAFRKVNEIEESEEHTNQNSC